MATAARSLLHRHTLQGLRALPSAPTAVSAAAPSAGRALCRSLSLSADPPPAIDASGSTALIFGGFGFGARQMEKHALLYEQHGFGVLPVLSELKELTTPTVAAVRGAALAEQLKELDQPTVIHTISGSFWTML